MNEEVKTYKEAHLRNLNETVGWHISNILKLLERGSDSHTLRSVIAEATQALSTKATAEGMEEILKSL